MVELEQNKQKLIDEKEDQNNNLMNQNEKIQNIVNIISENAKPLYSLIGGTADKWLEFKKTNVKFSIKMALIAFAVITLIVGSAAILTFLDKIDGSTFTFLLGLIVGYALTFIQSFMSSK